MTLDRQSLKNDVTNISIFILASRSVNVPSFFSLMSFTSTLIDARVCVQVDNDDIFVFKGVLPPFEPNTLVILSFPHFLALYKCSSWQLIFPQDNCTPSFYNKFSSFHSYRAIRPHCYVTTVWINESIHISFAPTSAFSYRAPLDSIFSFVDCFSLFSCTPWSLSDLIAMTVLPAH